MDAVPESLKRLVANPMSIAVVAALLKILLFAFIGGSYGYFRDELYFLACTEHLAAGYPDHAPLSVYLADFSRTIFGDSLYAIRLFPALAGATRILLTGLLVREFGGRRFATALACLAVLIAPNYLAIDNLLSMNSYESVFWMACVLSFIWVVKKKDPNYWLLFGAFSGLALMNKHSTVFFGLSFVVALLLTRHRKALATPQFWLAGAIAFVIFLPNLIWQVQNHWATIELLRNVRESGKNVVLSPTDFVFQQILILNPLTLLLWLPGLVYLLFSRHLREFRILGLTYVILFATMLGLNAKNYYLAPVYPFLFASGAVFWERMLGHRPVGKVTLSAGVAALIVAGILLAPLAIPVIPVERYKSYENWLGVAPPRTEVAHTGTLPQHFGDMFGWEEMVEKTARVYRSLPKDEQAKAVIFADNYGEAGAVDHFGQKFGLPKAISPHQSYFLWGYGKFDGSVAIVLGSKKEDAERVCREVETRESVGGGFNMPYENFQILICRGLIPPVDEFWKQAKHWN